MVRPYLPRFFREADSADLKVMVNNAGDKPLKGKLLLEILDPETQQSVLPLFQVRTASQPFAVEPGKGTSLTFAMAAPPKVGVYAFKVTAQAGDFSDGELRPLPVLPSRMHLTQSRFVTLRDKDSRTMTFEDLKRNDDPDVYKRQSSSRIKSWKRRARSSPAFATLPSKKATVRSGPRHSSKTSSFRLACTVMRRQYGSCVNSRGPRTRCRKRR